MYLEVYLYMYLYDRPSVPLHVRSSRIKKSGLHWRVTVQGRRSAHTLHGSSRIERSGWHGPTRGVTARPAQEERERLLEAMRRSPPDAGGASKPRR
jgi:hypothetical protein